MEGRGRTWKHAQSVRKNVAARPFSVFFGIERENFVEFGSLGNEKSEELRKLEALIHDPWAKDDDIEEVFLKLMADDLLNIGFDYFRRRGRGTLLFDLRGPLGWRRGEVPTLYYLTYDDLLEAGATPSSETQEEINTYDPDSEVPVIFLYDRGESGRVVSKGWDFRAYKN